MKDLYCPKCRYILYDVKAFIGTLDQGEITNIKYCSPCKKLYTLTEFSPEFILSTKPRMEINE